MVHTNKEKNKDHDSNATNANSNVVVVSKQLVVNNHKWLLYGDPLVNDIKSKQSYKYHDLSLLNANLVEIDQEMKAIMERKKQIEMYVEQVKADQTKLEKKMIDCKQSILFKWHQISFRIGWTSIHPSTITKITTTTTNNLNINNLNNNNNMETDNDVIIIRGGNEIVEFYNIPPITVILPVEVMLNILEYLSLYDITFSVSLVCKLWHRLSYSDSIWKNLFHRKWHTLDIHIEENRPFSRSSSKNIHSFWTSPLTAQQAFASTILPKQQQLLLQQQQQQQHHQQQAHHQQQHHAHTNQTQQLTQQQTSPTLQPQQSAQQPSNYQYTNNRNIHRKTPQSAIFPPFSSNATHTNEHQDHITNEPPLDLITSTNHDEFDLGDQEDQEIDNQEELEELEEMQHQIDQSVSYHHHELEEEEEEEDQQQQEQEQDMNQDEDEDEDEDDFRQSSKHSKRIRIDWRELYLKRQKIEHNWWNNICKSKKFSGHTDWVTCMQFDGKMLVTASWDAGLKLWNIDTDDCLVLSPPLNEDQNYKQQLLQQQQQQQQQNNNNTNNNNNQNNTNNNTSKNNNNNANNTQVNIERKGHTAGITCLQFKGTKLISGSSDSTLRIWDLTTGECTHVLKGHRDGVSCLTIIDDYTVASGSLDNTINLWSLETGRLLHTFANHTTGITCLYYKNNLLISGTMGGTLMVIDLPSRIVVQTLVGHSDRVTSIQWWDGPDGESSIVSSSWDYTLRVWNLHTGKPIHVLSGHTFRVRCINLRGNILVSGSWDKSVRVWDLLTGKCIHTLYGHEFNVWGVQFEGKRLVTAGWDRMVKVWDLETGENLYTLNGHNDSIICLCFKGSKLVTAAKEIIIWDFDI